MVGTTGEQWRIVIILENSVYNKEYWQIVGNSDNP